jgi:hypothetical protein
MLVVLIASMKRQRLEINNQGLACFSGWSHADPGFRETLKKRSGKDQAPPLSLRLGQWTQLIRHWKDRRGA